MTIPKLWIPLSAILAISIIADSAPAQTSPAKIKTEPPALAALHAIDEYEASLETWVPYTGQDDFEEREKASGHKAKQERAIEALASVSDPELHNDLNILMTDTSLILNAGMGLLLDKNDKSLPKRMAEFHSDRNLVATEIATNKHGLLRDAVLKRYQKK
jgi:hypothetical protein